MAAETLTPDAAAEALPRAVRAVEQLPKSERREALLRLLRANVHDVAVRATVEDGRGPGELAALADAVRDHVPAGAEDELNPRATVFVRLLRQGALEPAWMLAHDNASGVVRATRHVSTWAGGSTLRSRLPLPTLVDPGPDRLVHAWLPGFRDPRWSLPDELFDITDRVVLRGVLDEAVPRDGALHLFGAAYLGLLTAGPDDAVLIRFHGPGGAGPVTVAASRGRRPDLVQKDGPELTRLAWAGWSARIDLAALAPHPGSWRGELELVQQGVSRREPLGVRRGPLADRQIIGQDLTAHGRRFSIGTGPARAGLTLLVDSTGAGAKATEVLGRSARRALRAVRARATAART